MAASVRTGPAAAVLLAAGAALPLPMSTAALADSGIAGRWSGMVRQSDGQEYPVIMEFDAAGRGRSDYPSLNCSGKLSGTGAKGTYQFRETIASTGRADAVGSCIDGTIGVTVSGDLMTWSWSGKWKGQTITAAGTLRRE